ncbi:MAG: aminotransferase class I/II-fold pyridoxal phosphate-dependent enzyme [Candidatus Micrarchaeaceae archaeon]
MLFSKRSSFATNALEEDDALAFDLERKGAKVIHLNRGDPAEYFETPSYIKEAYIKAIKENKTHYTQTTGIPELREAVANRYKRKFGVDFDPSGVIVTYGVSEALYILNAALIDPGDPAVIFRPFYPLYVPFIELSEGVAYMHDYDEKSGWSIDTDAFSKHIKEAFKKLKRKPKYMLITNPNNPTGTVLSRQVLEDLADIANDNSMLIVSDEIYDEIIFNGAKFTSIAEVAKGMPYVILNGASKDYISTGFRIGYMIVPGNDAVSNALKEKFSNFASVRISVNAPAQYAVAEAISNEREHDKSIKELVRSIEDRVNFSMRLLNENPYLETVRPNSAFYIFSRIDLKPLGFTKDKEFTDAFLKEKYVQIARGSGFGSPNHIRIVALPSKEVLGEAITRLNDFCAERAKQHK